MRIDSCRRCGIKLKIKQKCSICTQPIKFVCNDCRLETEEQIHSTCRLVDMHYKPLAPEIA
ncbi:MAG: hypothetical protein K5783_04935 [Nitrosopumilus sp.]|nr:hypothetical protein [Nitrosopumilus sp.]